MDRAVLGDLQETTALLRGELADERDGHVDLLGAFGPRTHESDSDRAKRPLFALGVQAYGHALARPQRGEQELGRIGAFIGGARNSRVVGRESVRTDRDRLHLGRSNRVDHHAPPAVPPRRRPWWPTGVCSKFCPWGRAASVTMSPGGPLSVTVRFAESTASTEAVICATRSATPVPGAVAVIVAPRAARSSGCASSADGARLAAARISVQTLLRIRISMSGELPLSR